MNNTLNLAIRKVSRKLSVDQKLVEQVYKSYWMFIKEHISSLPLRELSQEEYDSTVSNVNLPYLGKLYVDYNKLRKVKPIGCQVLVTFNRYGWDDYNEAGILETGHSRGDFKTYQEVLAVGDDVKFVKPGDVVKINFYKYCSFENDPNSIKVNGTNNVLEYHLNKVEMVDVDGEPITCILIDQRDITYILEDFEEVTYDPKKHHQIIVEPPKKKLILPDNKFKA